MATFERPLKIGKTDNFTFTLSDDYLDEEVITSATVVAEEEHLSVDAVNTTDSVISALCTGISLGNVQLHYTWTTATRSGCETHIVKVVEC